MHVSRQLSLPAWNKRAAEVARWYWTQRGFTVSVGEGPSLSGVRGSGVGTWLPFYYGRDGAGFFDIDWKEPKGKMTMTPHSGHSVIVEVDLAFPSLVSMLGRETDWASAYVRLEIAGLHHILLDAGDLAEVWRRFTEAERQATARWVWTKRRAGRRVSDEWEDEISVLEVRLLLAGDDRTHAG